MASQPHWAGTGSPASVLKQQKAQRISTKHVFNVEAAVNVRFSVRIALKPCPHQLCTVPNDLAQQIDYLAEVVLNNCTACIQPLSGQQCLVHAVACN